MNVPANISVELICKNCKDLSNLIVQLKVIAGRKNPYFIYFPKTDSQGKTLLSINDFIGQFKDHWEMALMDYDGTPETAISIVEVSLFDPTWFNENQKLIMAWPLYKNERIKWASQAQRYSYLTTSRNLEFDFQRINIDLNKTNSIKMEVYWTK